MFVRHVVAIPSTAAPDFQAPDVAEPYKLGMEIHDSLFMMSTPVFFSITTRGVVLTSEVAQGCITSGELISSVK